MVITHPQVSQELVRQHTAELHADAELRRLAREARAAGTSRPARRRRPAALAAIVGRSVRRLAWLR